MSNYSERSIPELRNIVLDDPENHEAWWSLSDKLIHNKKWEEAITALEQVIRKQPEFIESYLTIANAYYQTSEPDMSILYLRMAAELEPDNARVLRDLGAVLLMQEEFRESEEKLRISLGLDGTDSYTWTYLGDLHFETDRCREGRVYYIRALMLESGMFFAWAGLGKCLHELGNYVEADNTLATALNINSQHHDTLSYMVYNKEKLQDWEGLKRYAEKHLELNPAIHDMYSFLGRAQYELGDYSAAEESFSKCVLESELNFRAWRGLVEVYKRTNSRSARDVQRK